MKALGELKKIWKILNEGWIGTIFYCILGLFVALAAHWGLSIMADSDLPIVTVSSTSMVPTLNVGDIALIKGQESYEVGDIIVFDGWEKEPIIHRIVAISDGEKVDRYDNWNQMDDEKILEYGEGKIYITKGDNNPSCDQCVGKSPVKENKIHGKEILTIPYLGWIKILFVRYFIQTPVIGISTSTILLIIYLIYKRW